MSSLWEQCKTTMKQKHMRPSPKIRNILNPCKKILPAKLSLVIEYIKRISLPMLQRTCVRGSMTVEAALVLPLFCFFVISMGNAIEIIRLHGNLEVALWNAGRQIGVYGALPEGQQGSADHRLEAVAVSYTYVKEQIEEQLGEEYLEMSPLDGGSDGLQFLESNIEGDIYTINMTYRIAGISQLSGFKKFRMANRYYGHMWNGYEIPEPEDEEYIYVTENGRVYHTNRECTHIRLSVRVVEATEALREYRPCEKCTDKIPHPTGGLLFFVSENGECYHSRRDCPGLKRTVQKIPKEEAFKYEVCSRCRGNNSKDRENKMVFWVEKIIWSVYLGKISLCDIRKRTIPVWLLFLGSLLVITDICIMGWKTGIIVETVPGIILLLLTKMTKAIGMADGIVLIQLGSICRDGQALLIFCLSLIYIFLYSMILYMLRRDRKRRIPYIPFLFLAYLTTWMI